MIFVSTMTKTNQLLNKLQIPNLSLQNIFIYLNIICRNNDIKHYNYWYFKITLSNYDQNV